MTSLTFRDASKSFVREDGNRMLVLDKISFNVPEAKITCVLGPSGCGKSTLLHVISGLERLDAGDMEWRSNEGRVVDSKSIRSGYVFQDPRLLDWKRVDENVVFALRGMQVPEDLWESRVQLYLSMVGLMEFRKQYPLYLSGGMRQRVGLARGLAVEPEILLLDEPFSKLDQLTARQLRTDTLTLCAKLSQTTLVVTHDVEEAAYLSDQVIVLSNRPTRVIARFENPLPPKERDFDHPVLIGLKKEILQAVLGETRH